MIGIRSSRGVAWPVLVVLLLFGCARGRGIIEITPPATINPNSGAFARIASVNDARRFEAEPSDPSTPSLMNSSEINDPRITARAVARKRGSFGAAFGDIVLPSNQTVADLVRAAARKALNDRGYVVVEPDSPNYAAAAPLKIDIAQFWSWFTPGFSSVRIEFKATVNLQGEAILERDPSTVTSYQTSTGFAMTGSDWTDLIQHGVEDIGLKIQTQIRSPNRSH